MSRRPRPLLVACLTLACGTAGFGGIATGSGVASAAVTPRYYLALGDSLAANVGASPSSNSYVNRTYAHELTRYPGLALNNIACGGATTGSMLNNLACGKTVTQVAEAEAFLRAHRGQVPFVTIDIGGNDAGGCIGADGVNETCAANVAVQIQSNLTTILARLKAAYPGVRVIGMNYYTPPLAFWLTGASGQQVARDSVPAAKTFNDLLVQIYAAAGFKTADVSKAFDNDNLALTGSYNGVTVPQNVANLCSWTLQCSNNNVHANNTGHLKIANAFTAVIDTVPAVTPLSITTAISLPAGKIGVPYSKTLVGTGGTKPYRWKRIGKLPRGLKLAARTGVISGTPKTKAVTSILQMRLTDKSKPKATVTKTFVLPIT
jgi:lysophospholipase L1-like esterase